ncbi:hypothetical protein MPH_14212, partial [Macrophomina phaseolina MS6]
AMNEITLSFWIDEPNKLSSGEHCSLIGCNCFRELQNDELYSLRQNQ